MWPVARSRTSRGDLWAVGPDMDVPQADPAEASSLGGERAGTPARSEPLSVPGSPGSSGGAGASLRTAEPAGPAAAAHTCRSRSRPLFAAAQPRVPLPACPAPLRPAGRLPLPAERHVRMDSGAPRRP